MAPLREKRKRERAPRARFPLALIGLVKELRFKGSKIFAKIDRKSKEIERSPCPLPCPLTSF